MTDEPDPRDARAAEYVLGTLTLEERRAVEREMVADPAFAAEIRAWEQRLVPLAEGASPVEPSAGLWERIVEAISGQAQPASNVVAWPGSVELARLRRSRGLWRGTATAAAAIAAALLVVVAADRLAPIPVPRSGLVAVVNRSGELPALIVRVDPVAGIVQVRSLATEVPAGRSLELWSIVGQGPPRSLGVLDPAATRVAVAEADRTKLEGATLAVTVEPTGGSPTGGPTGPVVYTGKLVSERE